MKRKTVRLPIMMEAKMVETIDDWSFSNRIRTRAGAVRALIEKGLAAEELKKEKGETVCTGFALAQNP